MRPHLRYLIGVALIAAAYYGAARLGFALAFEANAAAIWIPAGLSIGALGAFGLRYWPAVVIGEALATVSTGMPLGVVAGEAVGNTAEAVLGAYILLAALQGRKPFMRLRDVVSLAAFVAPVSSVVSATVGVSSLVAGGVLRSEAYPDIWAKWVLADMTGILVVTPAILVFASCRFRCAPRERALEAVVLGLVLVALSPAALLWEHGRPYLLLPLLLWAAIRFLQPGAAGASLLVAVGAIGATASERGFFSSGSLEQDLLYAQLFMSLAMLTGLAVAIITAEREVGERRLAAVARQQRAVAELGQRALAGPEREPFLNEVAGLVAATLDVELSEVQELLPDGESLLLRAGVGWKEHLVGHATLAADPSSQAGYTLSSAGPVVVSDMRTETRFDGSGLHGDYGVLSGISVVVDAGVSPYGVLAVHTTSRRDFTADDVNFLQAVANVLAGAIRRAERERELRESEERLLIALEAGHMGTWDWDLQTDEVVSSGSLESLRSTRARSTDDTAAWFAGLIHPDDRERVSAALALAFESDAPYAVEFRLQTENGYRWHAERARIVRDQAGRPVRMVGATADVTAQREAEEELRRSRELYRLVVENARDLISLVDLEGGVIYASPSHRHVLGLEADELLGRNPLDFLHPEDVGEARERMGEAAAGRSSTPTQARLRAKDGSWVLVEALATPIYDESGTPAMILATSRDVTARHEAEHALRMAEQKYRTLVEQLPLVTYMDALDMASSNIYTSPQIEPLLGYSPQEWLEDRELFVKTLHPDDRGRVIAEHAWTHAAGEPLKTEYRLVARDGRIVWFQDEAVVVRDDSGEPLFLQGYLLDITERKQAEEALAERENLLQTIIETEPECVKLIAPDGALLQMNRAGLEMIEADSLEEIVGRDVSRLVAPEHRSAFVQLTRTALGGGSGSLEFELVGLKGTRRWMETHAVPLREANGEVRAALSVTRDVTERRRLKEQLVQSQKMEAVGRLAGGIAHDFNNLLTGIIGYSDLLRAGLAESDPLRADADEVRKAAERAASLTRQLLAFGRRQVLEPRVIELNRVVEDMDRMLRRLIGEDIELVTACASGIGRVEADPGQLEQVIANLVVNARDAMPDGGRLVIETASARVDEATAASHAAEMLPGAYAVLTVSDTGVGMDAETQAHLFEPFFTTKEVGKGTGLGLATVYGIVKQSGGFIWVYSEPGRGTSFRIYLPQVEKDVETPAELPAEGTTEGGNETVLVVEDEQLVRNLIAEELSGRGYEVLTARNGVDALALDRDYDGDIDVIVTDVIMPEMGGLELAQRLTEARPGIRIVYMSGYSEGAIAEDAGPWPLLQKPFNAASLATKIREVLDVTPAA